MLENFHQTTPWLYAEATRGLGIPLRRHSVVGIEDSGAGVLSILLAGFALNSWWQIVDSGTQSLCTHFDDTRQISSAK